MTKAAAIKFQDCIIIIMIIVIILYKHAAVTVKFTVFCNPVYCHEFGYKIASVLEELTSSIFRV